MINGVAWSAKYFQVFGGAGALDDGVCYVLDLSAVLCTVPVLVIDFKAFDDVAAASVAFQFV